MTEYQVNAVAAYFTDVEADSPAEAIEKARQEIKDALKSGDFQLSEIESNENGGDGFAFEGQ